MKKTLITLLALTGVAMGDVGSLTIGTNDISYEDEILKFDLDSISGASVGTCDPSAVTGANGFSPKIQFVQNQPLSDCYWTLEFTLENKSASAITIENLALTMNAVTSTGATHSNGIGAVSPTFTLGTSTYEGTVTLGAQSASGTVTMTSETPYVIAAGDSQKLTMTVIRTANGYTGFATVTAGSISYSVAPIPEPATATLSLLALAGLAARRRRK